MFILLLSGTDIVSSTYEANLREYARLLRLKNPMIYQVSNDQYDSICKKYRYVESVEKQTEEKNPLYCTDSDLEMLSNVMEDDLTKFAMKLHKIDKWIKMFHGKSAKRLRKAIHAFLKERVENKDFSIDEYDEVGRLMEKVKLRDYAKSILRRSYKDVYELGGEEDA